MVRQSRSRIKEHKSGVGERVAFVGRETKAAHSPHDVPGRYLDGLTDRQLGAATRRVIEWVVRPGIDTGTAAESLLLRRVLEDIEIVARPTRPHGASKWIGNRALRLVAAVLRRTHEGRTIEQACMDLAVNYVLPIEAVSKDSDRTDTVLTTFKRARKHLEQLGMLEPLMTLLRAERVHQGREAEPGRPLSAADHLWFTLPMPVLPPDFPRHGEPEPPEWEPWNLVVEFLYGPVSQRVLGRNKKSKK